MERPRFAHTEEDQGCAWLGRTGQGASLEEARTKMVLAEFGTGQVFWSMLYFFLFFIYIWMFIAIFGDIFRSRDLSGGAKAIWTLFVIFLPFIGICSYLIARGKKMNEHAVEAAQAQQDYFRTQVQSVVTTGNGADELAKLAKLKDEGVINDAEFQQMKAKLVAA